MDILAIVIAIMLIIAAWSWVLKDSNDSLGKIHASLIKDLKDIEKYLEATQKGLEKYPEALERKAPKTTPIKYISRHEEDN